MNRVPAGSTRANSVCFALWARIGSVAPLSGTEVMIINPRTNSEHQNARTNPEIY